MEKWQDAKKIAVSKARQADNVSFTMRDWDQ